MTTNQFPRSEAATRMYRVLRDVEWMLSHDYVTVSYTHLTLPTKRIV